MPAACPSPPRTSFASRGVSLATRGIGACRPDHHTTRRRREGRDRLLSVDSHGLVVGDASAFRTSSTAKTHADVLRVRNRGGCRLRPAARPPEPVDGRLEGPPVSYFQPGSEPVSTAQHHGSGIRVEYAVVPSACRRRASHRQRVGPSRSRRPDALRSTHGLEQSYRVRSRSLAVKMTYWLAR